MNKYEALLDESYRKGLIVKEKPLQSSDGRIKGNKIAIRKGIKTVKKKACTLAEEIGHFETTVGDITDMSNPENRKQERKARLYGYNKMIGLRRLIDAFEYGCKNRYEIAEYLDITEEYLQECIDCYRDKYGIMATVDNYCVIFIPHLMVGKMID